jgi:hypothetical protein
VKSIAESAFEGNILTTLTFQANSQVTLIGNRSFYNSGLDTLDIPLSVITIGESAFELNKISSFTGGINLETIGARAFASNKLTSLTIPNKVKTVSANAFSSNSLITVMFLGSDVETIGTSAFQGNSMTKLFIPKSVSSLGASAFRNNKLREVYFFSAVTIGTNCFIGNDNVINAYYLTDISNDFISTPSPFTSKTSKSVVEMLTPLLDEVGVSVETLVNDDYTFDQLAEAQATAEQLFGYFDNISSPVPLSSYISYFSVSALKTAKPSLTITNFKDAEAPIQQVFDQFKNAGLFRLSAMISANYTVEEIASNVTASPVLTVTDFKQANANKKQVCDHFALSLVIGAGYSVDEVIENATTVPTIGDFKSASADIQQVFTKYGLSEMIGVFYRVDEVINGVNPDPSIGDFKDASAPIQQVFTQFGLSAMITANYTVSSIIEGVTSTTLGYSNFASAGNASAVYLMTYFDYNLLLANFTVSQIKVASNDTSVKLSNRNLNAGNFETHDAPIWQMLNAFDLSVLTPLYTTQELVSNSQDARVTLTVNQNLTLAKMKELNDELWQVMNYYSDLADLLQVDYPVADLVAASNQVDGDGNRLVTVTALQDLGNKLASFVAANTTVISRPNGVSRLSNLISYFSLSALFGHYSVAELKAAKSTLTAGDFKGTQASVQEVYNNYTLSDMISGLYSVEELVNGVSIVPSIGDFKAASAPILQVFHQYKTVGTYRLSAMIGANYSVADIVTGVTGDTVSPAIGIGDFKDASAPILDVFQQYKTVNNRLYPMIQTGYTVAEIVYGFTGVTVDPPIGITDFKDASAPIQDVFTQFGLSQMVKANYTVSSIIEGVTSTTLEYSDFVQVDADAGLSAAYLMTYFDYNLLLPNFTVSQIKTASSDTGVKSSNQNLVAQSFKDHSASIWQMLNAFALSDLTPLYTTQELVVASNEKDGSDNFLVTVIANRSLDLDKMKQAGDELWQVMNYYSSLADLLQVDYPVADLVAASNQVDGNGVRLVTVPELQDLGTTTETTGGLAKFVAANATVITRTTVSRLWNLVNYFELPALLVHYSVAELNTTSTDTRVSESKTVTLTSLKNAPADTDDMLTEFGLHSLFDNGYTIADLKSLVTVAEFWALTLFTELNHVNPTVQQLFEAEYSLQELWTGIDDVATIYDGLTVKPTVAEWWALPTSKPSVQQLSVKYGLQELWNGINNVSTIRTGLTTTPTVSQFKELTTPPTIQQLLDGGYTLKELVVDYSVEELVAGLNPVPSIGDFKAAEAPILQVFHQYKTVGTYRLSAMIGANYSVADIVAGVIGDTVTPAIGIGDFKQANAPILQVFQQYKTVINRLSAMIQAGYTVADIVTGVTGVTVDPPIGIGDFKDASAPIQEVYEQYKTVGTYRLSAMIGATYSVSEIVTGVTDSSNPIGIGDFKDASAPILEVYEQYKTVNNRLSAMIGANYSVSEIVTGVTGVTVDPPIGIGDFKDASAPILQVFQQYKTVNNRLSAMIQAGYTVAEIVYGVTGVTVDPEIVIGDFKDASAPIQEVYEQYKTVGTYRLSAMIGALYSVSEIVTGVTDSSNPIGIGDFKDASAPILQVFQQYKTVGTYRLSAMIGATYSVADIVAGVIGVTVDPAIGIGDFKQASAPIQQVYNQYKTVTNRLSAMIGATYSVSEIVTGVTDTSNPIEIGDFKDASAPIQQVFTQYGLSAMIDAEYIVSDIKAGVTSTTLEYSDFVGAEAEAWNLMTQFDYNLLLPNFSVSQIKDASSDSRVKASNSSLTAQKFKDHSASIWQMLNAFALSLLTPLYTTRQLVDASNQKDGSENFLVTVLEYQDLTASDMKGAEDELWQIMNVYPLADLLQLDYSVAELVAASNLIDSNGDKLVTVTDLQDLGTKLSSFVAANTTVITRTTVSRLWNLVNYFSLSDLVVHYNVAQLNATSTDTRVSESKTVTVAKLHDIPMPIQDMLTEFGLQALWDDDYTIAELKSLNVTVAQFWALSSVAENHRVKPTVQQLFVAEYSLQNLWTGIGDAATIYDGLSVKPTVAQWWALTSGKPTVQQLSARYGLQQLWDGIVTSTRSDDVSTIRTGLTPTPTVSQFKELTGAPTVKQLFDGGYTLAALVAGLYTVNQIRNTTTGIGNASQQTPTLVEFKNAGALLWQLLNCSLYRNMPGAVGMSGFPLGHFIRVGYKVSEIVEASKLKDAFNNYLVDEDSNNQNLTPLKFNPDGMQYLSDTNQFVYFTASEKMDILCDVLSYFEPGQIINNADDGLYDYYFRVPKMIEASKLKDELGNYKVTKVDNQELDTKFSRFITGTDITKVRSGLTHRLLRYKSLFTSFSIIAFEDAYDVGEVLGANASYNSGTDNAWDAQNDWRVSLSELKSVPIPTTRMVEYYMTRSQGLQTLWDLQYSVSELRLASNEVFDNIYTNPDRISVQKLLALSTSGTRPRPTIRLLQAGGYTLELLSLGMSGGSLSPLIADNTGMSPPPTVADFYNETLFPESSRRPSIQQLYNTYGLQKLFNDLSVFDQISYLNSEGMNLIKTGLTPETTVSEWWALSPKPTVEKLSSNGKYGLQALWNGIGDVEIIHNGLDVKPTVAQWWDLSPKPTVAQLFVVYNLQALWDGIRSVSTIKSGISPTVTQWWALSTKPSINQLSEGNYTLQELWDYFASVETVYDALTSKPSVSEWWTLSINTLTHVLKPTVAQLSVRYSLQLLWNGIGNVSTIKAGLQTTVAQFWALSQKPTIQQLYVGGFEVAELIAGNTGIKISDVLSSVSQNGNTSASTIIADLKTIGFKINLPAPRIKSASYTSGSVILTLVQASPDIPITQYLVSYTSDGGQTWSEYAVVRDSTSTAVPKAPLLPNVSGNLIINGITSTRKLHSFRLKAEGSEIQSNTSNTIKNLLI